MRQDIADTASAMLSGELSYLIGARRLSALYHEVGARDDADLHIFVGIALEIDDFPLGAVREYWDAEALRKLEPQVEAAERWAAELARDACHSLVARFSGERRHG